MTYYGTYEKRYSDHIKRCILCISDNVEAKEIHAAIYNMTDSNRSLDAEFDAALDFNRATEIIRGRQFDRATKKLAAAKRAKVKTKAVKKVAKPKTKAKKTKLIK